jgi:hypothetical protein
MSYLSIPHGGDGSAKYPFLLTFAPSSSPGHVANPNGIAKDTTTGVFYMKTGTGATDWTPITGSLAYETDEDYYKDRARTLLASPRLTCWWWDDLLEPQGEKWTASLSTGNTFSTKYNACGVATLGNDTRSAGSWLYIGTEAPSTGNALPGGSDGSWYMAWRGKKTGTDGNHYAEMWSRNGTSTYIYFGEQYGAGANQHRWGIGLTGTGAVASGVDNDFETHVHELCRTGTTTTYYLDETAIMSGDYYHAGNGAIRFRWGSNGTSANVGTLELDFAAFAVGGNNPRTIT